jgi:hypothetical protein
VDRIATNEGEKALKEITEDLKRVEQAKPQQDAQISSYDIDELLHEKQHQLRDLSSQLDVARVDAATTTLQLESAVKQRDHWRAKYGADMKDVQARHTKEREMEATLEVSEKEGLRKENTRLQKELSLQQHEVVRLQNELSTEIARAQMMEQQAQHSPSESVSYHCYSIRIPLPLKQLMYLG